MNSLPMVFISPGEFHSTYDYTLYIFLIIFGLLNFILKKWCTISRGAKPHARNANVEKMLKKVAHTIGVFRDERSDGPKYTNCVYYYIYIYISLVLAFA